MQAFNPNTINFTDQAILHFTNALSGKPDEFAIRIGVREAGCSGYEYIFEYTNKENDNDILFQHNSCKILIDKESHKFMQGSEIDFQESGLNQGIVFKNPNAKVTCGCGESFSV